MLWWGAEGESELALVTSPLRQVLHAAPVAM